MLMFTLNSCTRTVYVSGETGDVVQYTKPNSSEFCAMVRLDVTNYEIWWDKNTEVTDLVLLSNYESRRNLSNVYRVESKGV